MRVFERIGRIVRADAHGVMDQLEERSLLLKQHLREAELEVAQKRAKLEAIDEDRRRLSEEGQRLEEEVAALDEDVELAMKGEDPELTRFAVRRLLPKRETLRTLFASAAQAGVHRTRLHEQLEIQEAQLVELRTRVRTALARPAPESMEWVGEPIVTDEEIDLEILRRRDDRRDIEMTGEGRR